MEIIIFSLSLLAIISAILAICTWIPVRGLRSFAKEKSVKIEKEEARRAAKYVLSMFLY